MIMVVAMRKSRDGELYLYTIVETVTVSASNITPDELKKLIEDERLEVRNAKVINNEIVLNKWPYEIPTVTDGSWAAGSRFTLVGVGVDDNNADIYLVADHKGYCSWIRANKFADLTEDGYIGNCKANEGQFTISIEDVDDKEPPSEEFVESIKSEYSKYIAKSKLMGKDADFKYRVEKDRVIIENYIGTSKNVVIPNFVTDIESAAFGSCEMETLKLNEGLKIIGTEAFVCCKISKLIIPSTVQLICNSAFMDTRVVGNGRGFKENVVRFDGNTIVLNQNQLGIPAPTKVHTQRKE